MKTAYHSAQPGQKAGQLDVRPDPFKYPHVCEPDFLRKVQPLVNHRADGRRGSKARQELTLMNSSFVYSGMLVHVGGQPSPTRGVARFSAFHTHSSNTFVTLNTVTIISTALYPASHSSLSLSSASSMFPLTQCRSIVCTIKGCG